MFILLLTGLLTSGLITAYLNGQRGHSRFAGFVVGTVLGPLGILLALLSATEPAALVGRERSLEAERVSHGELKKCPHCAEAIRAEAMVCRYCGRDLAFAARKPALANPEPLKVPAQSTANETDAAPAPPERLPVASRFATQTPKLLSRIEPRSQPDDAIQEDWRSSTALQEEGGHLGKPRLFRDMDSEGLPAIEAGIFLERREQCHFKCYAEWYELRPVSRRWRDHDSSRTIEQTSDSSGQKDGELPHGPQDLEPVHIDSGRVFLTNRRLIFLGANRNTTVRLRKIVDFTPYVKGIEIQKTTGKGFFLAFTSGVDVFASILGQAIERIA